MTETKIANTAGAGDQPYAWTIPGDDNADCNGFITARISQQDEFTKPLYALPAPVSAVGVGDPVRVKTTSYEVNGTVLVRFKTLRGDDRVVVEFDTPKGLLHIHNPSQLSMLAASPHPAGGVETVAWLIEKVDTVSGVFWMRGGNPPTWTQDANSALKFFDKADAEDFLTLALGEDYHIARATEHLWQDARTQTPPSLERELREAIPGLFSQIPSTEGASPPRTSNNHLQYMLGEILAGRVTGDKAHRWFAFVQGVLAARGYLDVDKERDRTRPFFTRTKAIATESGPTRGVEDVAERVAEIISKTHVILADQENTSWVSKQSADQIAQALASAGLLNERGKVLEEAAKVAERRDDHDSWDYTYECGYDRGRDDCARDIRALASKPSSEGRG